MKKTTYRIQLHERRLFECKTAKTLKFACYVALKIYRSLLAEISAFLLSIRRNNVGDSTKLCKYFALALVTRKTPFETT